MVGRGKAQHLLHWVGNISNPIITLSIGRNTMGRRQCCLWHLHSACVCVCTHTHDQSCLNLCNHVDCSLPGSSVHGISQARILEWVAVSFSRGSSQPRDWTYVSWVLYIPRWILYHCTTLAQLISDGWKVDWTTFDQCIWVCWLEHLANGDDIKEWAGFPCLGLTTYLCGHVLHLWV